MPEDNSTNHSVQQPSTATQPNNGSCVVIKPPRPVSREVREGVFPETPKSWKGLKR